VPKVLEGLASRRAVHARRKKLHVLDLDRATDCHEQPAPTRQPPFHHPPTTNVDSSTMDYPMMDAYGSSTPTLTASPSPRPSRRGYVRISSLKPKPTLTFNSSSIPVADEKATTFELVDVQQALPAPKYTPRSRSPALEVPVRHGALSIRQKRKPGANVTGRPSKAQKVKPQPQPRIQVGCIVRTVLRETNANDSKPNLNITIDLPAGGLFLRPTKTKSHYDFTSALMRSEKTKILEKMLNEYHAPIDSDSKSSFLSQPIALGDWRGAYCTVQQHTPIEERDECDIDHFAQLRFSDQVTWAELLERVYEGHPSASCYEVSEAMGYTYRGPYYEFYAVDVSSARGSSKRGPRTRSRASSRKGPRTGSRNSSQTNDVGTTVDD
jgi:hypothetical protein